MPPFTFSAETPALPAVLQALPNHAGARVLIARTLWAKRDEANALKVLAEISDPGPVHQSASTGEVVDFMGRLMSGGFDGYAPEGRALQIPRAHGEIELVTEASVTAAHQHGLEVHVWTVNDAAEMRDLLRLGVDGIISDDTRLLVATLG